MLFFSIMVVRSPVCTVVGHVDHGKSSILDKIRGTCIVKGEAGAITQAIGASVLTMDVIKSFCGSLLDSMKMDFTIPGLLFIDTPGHAAFNNLRKRGGSLADIAILVVDINEGFMPQTIEAIEILKANKVPFIVAANKIDLIHGWKKQKGFLLPDIKSQGQSVQNALDNKLYELVGKIYEFGFNAERFDRVTDYTSQIAIVPVSAETGEGMPELLMVLTGLAQKYLENSLKIDVDKDAVGTILEVKDEKGMGKVLDAIIYEGTLKINDILVIGNIGVPIITKVRALFEPFPMCEMMDKKSKFKSVKQVCAATGVRISASDLDEAIGGMPLRSCSSDVEKCKQEVMKEVQEVLIETDKEGVIVKADALGSLEALLTLLKEKNILIASASIGNITKKDISKAKVSLQKNPLTGVILGFNTDVPSDVEDFAQNEDINLITSDVIYSIIDNYEKWRDAKKKEIESKKLDVLVRPGKIKVIPGYVFRQSNPAIFGAEILIGSVKAGDMVMTEEGKVIDVIKGMEEEQKAVHKVEAGKQVAMSLPKTTIGRQLVEGQEFYTDIPEEDFRKLKEMKEFLSASEKELLKEIAIIKRRHNPVWGV